MAASSFAVIAKETLDFITQSVENGSRMGQRLVAARERTEHFKEEDEVTLVQRPRRDLHQMEIEVTREDTLFAAKRCVHAVNIYSDREKRVVEQ